MHPSRISPLVSTPHTLTSNFPHHLHLQSTFPRRFTFRYSVSKHGEASFPSNKTATSHGYHVTLPSLQRRPLRGCHHGALSYTPRHCFRNSHERREISVVATITRVSKLSWHRLLSYCAAREGREWSEGVEERKQ